LAFAAAAVAAAAFSGHSSTTSDVSDMRERSRAGALREISRLVCVPPSRIDFLTATPVTSGEETV
jgi:hypothetical protein